MDSVLSRHQIGTTQKDDDITLIYADHEKKAPFMPAGLTLNKVLVYKGFKPLQGIDIDVKF